MNVLSMIKDIGQNSIDFITGDGGLDYSNDYSRQEENSLKLIYSEIFMALNLQKIGGTFICKIFDIFLKETISLLYILRENYDRLIIHKPKISRYSNSEKYIICIGYKGYNKNIINNLCHNFNDNLIKNKITTIFLKDILSLNNIYSKTQIEHIYYGIKLIKSKYNINKPIKNQILSAIKWCNQYKIDINNNCPYINLYNLKN